MESQKIVVPSYLTSEEVNELEEDFRQIEYYYVQLYRQRKFFQEFKIPFPEILYEKLKPKSLKHISSFPMEFDDILDNLRREKLELFCYYSDIRDVEWFCEKYEISLPDKFWENNKRCSKWKYLELKK